LCSVCTKNQTEVHRGIPDDRNDPDDKKL
jgi:hypothetical protein